ncbi:MAG: GNAT family N-acetyltransferase [Pseudonocardiales bacterium]|nr:GNAT family N-acetyltransferase [Pseudonocardiales bacterium]
MPTPRQAQPHELNDLVELAHAFYLEDGFATPPEQLRANLANLLADDSARVAVIDNDGGQLLGFAITTTSFGLENGPIAELEDLYVTPESRHAGLGRALIADSTTWASRHGCTYLEIVVTDGEQYTQLIRYYHTAGFSHPRTLLRKRLS